MNKLRQFIFSSLLNPQKVHYVKKNMSQLMLTHGI